MGHLLKLLPGHAHWSEKNFLKEDFGFYRDFIVSYPNAFVFDIQKGSKTMVIKTVSSFQVKQFLYFLPFYINLLSIFDLANSICEV